MNFFKTVGNSIYSPWFYSTVLTKSFKQSLGYFLLLILLLTILRLITLVNPLLVEAPKALQGIAQELINCFPKDLEIKIKNGQTSINKEEPYFIPPCMEGWDNSSVVIDTKTPYSPAKFEEYKSAAWMTEDAIVYKKSDVESRTYSLSKIQDLTLTRTVTESYYKMFLPYLKFIGPILLILSFFGLYIFYSLRLIHLLMIAALIFGLGKIFKKDVSFRQGYKLGLYAITLGLVVDLVINLSNRWTHFSGFPFMVTILTLAVVLVNLILPKKNDIKA